MKLARRQFLRWASVAAALPAVSRAVEAQSYPDRPVRMVVPYAPGGPTDAITRILAQRLSERLGRQFYVENVGGGGGNIAMGRVARMAPDGYTLLMINPSYVVNPDALRESPLRVRKGLRSGLARGPYHFGDRDPSVGAGDTLKELVALIKAIPANTAMHRRGPERRVISSVRYSASRLASTWCTCRSTARDWRSARRSLATRRSASPRPRRPRSR